jgi:transcriptional regulator with XRE-family HTH domain
MGPPELITPPSLTDFREPSGREVLSSRVAATRTAKGISRAELARAAGIARNSLYLIEARAANTRLDTVCRLAVALDVDIRSLFSTDTETEKPRRRKRDIRTTLSKNIAVIRERAGMSQEELNRQCGFVRGYMWVIESSDQDLSIDTLDAVARALCMPLSRLFSLAG